VMTPGPSSSSPTRSSPTCGRRANYVSRSACSEIRARPRPPTLRGATAAGRWDLVAQIAAELPRAGRRRSARRRRPRRGTSSSPRDGGRPTRAMRIRGDNDPPRRNRSRSAPDARPEQGDGPPVQAAGSARDRPLTMAAWAWRSTCRATKPRRMQA
jgi:hypothetical protein